MSIYVSQGHMAIILREIHVCTVWHINVQGIVVI